MPELVAIWVAGCAVLVLTGSLAAAFLRFTPAGRALGVTWRELLQVLAVCVALGCAVLSLLALVT